MSRLSFSACLPLFLLSAALLVVPSSALDFTQDEFEEFTQEEIELASRVNYDDEALNYFLPPVIREETPYYSSERGQVSNPSRRLSFAEEKEALELMFESTGGSDWTNNSMWLTADHCSWFGIECTDAGSVKGVILRNNNLIGTLPPGLFDALPSLEGFFMTDNELSASGKLPSLDALSSLVELDIQDNWFTGTLPSLDSLSSLVTINIAYNNFTGQMPSLQNLTSIYEFRAYHDGTKGPGFTGTLPEFGSIPTLAVFLARRHSITGTIPSLEGLPKLFVLAINYNELQGTIPDTSKNPMLYFFVLTGNKLQGTVPNALLDNSVLTMVNVGYNQLTGTLPAWDRTPPVAPLRFLYFNNNGFTGTIPALTGVKVNIELNDNELTGTIPSLSSATFLQNLHLENNKLTGAIPDWSNCGALASIRMQNNDLLGSPNSECDRATATTLRLIGGSDGPYPAAMGDYTEISPAEFIELAASDTPNRNTILNENGTDYKYRAGRPIFRSSENWYLYYWEENGVGLKEVVRHSWKLNGFLAGALPDQQYIISTAEHPLLIGVEGHDTFTDRDWMSFDSKVSNFVSQPDMTATCLQAESCTAGTEYFSQLAEGQSDDDCGRCGADIPPVINVRKLIQTRVCEGCEGCFNCAAGTYSPGGGESCISCTPGNYCPEKAAEVVPCPAGVYGSQDNLTDADCTEKCGDGLFCVEGSRFPLTCDTCVIGEYQASSCSATHDASCVSCPSGKFTDKINADECKSCVPGRISYFDGNTTTQCEYCPAGWYSNAEKNECLACPPGKYNPFEGVGNEAGNDEVCVLCMPGFFGAAGIEGASSAEEGCKACDPGHVTTGGGGATECKPCDEGTWQSDNECLACAAGRYGSTKGLTTEECSGECPPGMHSYRYAKDCRNCIAGKYASAAGMEDCTPCGEVGDGFTSEVAATECVCGANTYLSDASSCSVCQKGMACYLEDSGIGATLESLAVEGGYWRKSENSVEVIQCPYDGTCQGGMNSSCLPGNEGVLCALCSDSYYRPSFLTSCAICDNTTTEAVISALAIVTAMIIALYVVVAINRRAPTGMLRPIIDVVQRFSVMMLFNSSFPEQLVSLGRYLGALSFSLDVVAPECAGFGTSFYEKFAATVGLLASLCGVMLVPLLRTKVANGWTMGETLESEAAGTVFRDIFVIVLMVHPSVSGKAMQFFRCRRIDGTSYLMADYSLECFDSTWWTYLPFVVLVLLTFSLGVPFAIFYVLRKRAADLYDAQGKPALPSLDVLYAVYREGAYWYESVQMLFKVALWSTLVFFEFKSEMQLATALVVNVLQLCVYMKIEPMGGPDAKLLNFMQSAGLLLTTYINFGGFAINYLNLARKYAELNGQSDDSYEQKISVINNIMVFLTFSLMATVVCVALKNAYVALRNTSLDDVRNFIAEKRSSLAASFSRVLRCLRGSSGDQDAVAVVGNPITQGVQPAAVNIQMAAQQKPSTQSP